MGSTTGGEEEKQENPFDEATLSSAQKLIKSIRRQEHSRLITFRTSLELGHKLLTDIRVSATPK